MRIVPVVLDSRRWGPAAIPVLKWANGSSEIDPEQFSRLLHYYSEKVAQSHNRPGDVREWNDIPEPERDRRIAATAMALMEWKVLSQDEESLTAGVRGHA